MPKSNPKKQRAKVNQEPESLDSQVLYYAMLTRRELCANLLFWENAFDELCRFLTDYPHIRRQLLAWRKRRDAAQSKGRP